MSYCCTQKVDQDDLFSDGEDEDWDNEILAYLEFVVNGEQKRCEVVKGENIIGRDLDAQSTTKIIIDDLTVSSNHARISAIDGNTFLLTDLKSTNGTQINQLLLTDAFRPYELPSGSIVRFGRVKAKFSSCTPSLTEVMQTSSASTLHTATISPFVFIKPPLDHSSPLHQTVPAPILSTALTRQPSEKTLKETTNDLRKTKNETADDLLNNIDDKYLSSSQDVFSDMLPNEREAVERNGNCDQSNDNQNENTGGESVNKVHDEDAVRSELQNEIKKEVENKIGDKQKESEKDESSNANQNTNSASISANTNFESDEIYRLMLAEAQKPRADILFSNSQSQQQTSAETTTATTREKIFDIPTSPTKVSHSTPTNRVKSSASNPSTSRIKRSRRRSNRTSKITTWEKRFQQTLTASNNRESAPTAMDVDGDSYDRNVEMDKRNNSIIDVNDEDDFANVKNSDKAVKKRRSSNGGNHKKRNIRITPKSTSACVTPTSSTKEMKGNSKKLNSSHRKRRSSNESCSYRPHTPVLCSSSANTPSRRSLRLSAQRSKRTIDYSWQLDDDDEDEENIPLLQLKKRLTITDN